MAHLMLIVTFIVGTACHADDAADAFQGLKWGASEGEISARFPDKLKRESCDSILAEFQKAAKHACGNPYIETYEVAGIPFKLSFALAEKDRTLAAVDLFYADEPPKLQRDGLSTEQWWQRRNEVLVEALQARYGTPHYENPKMGDARFRGYAAGWQTQTSEIKLYSTLAAGQNSANVKFSVTYRPRGGRDATKL